jgi:outer membrane receptor protein involved in Fe transport
MMQIDGRTCWFTRRRVAAVLVVLVVVAGLVSRLSAQGLGGAGTIEGIVKDPSGAVVVGATVIILNPVTDFTRTAPTDGRGHFVFRNLPPNPYHLVATAPGFQTFEQDIDVRSSVPIELPIALKIAGASETVNVSGHIDLIESNPTAHTDLDQKQLARLPIPADSSGLGSAITLAAPGVVADSNGFFHPLGDHAQTQFSIDNQPVTDQQSRTYSNQISLDAVQSMEVMTGVPPAEFGDKDSLVVRIITKSGLGQGKPEGSASFAASSFGTLQGQFSVGIGSDRYGNFLSVSTLRGNRFLDSPEFTALHDTGDSETVFDRLDFRPNDRDAFHLNLSVARSAFQVPNTYDQQAAGQDQRQRIATFNIAPGWTRVINPTLLLAANAYVRHDAVTYSPSANPFADFPATIAQERSLTNYGAKLDLSYYKGRHNAKVGVQLSFTSLSEHFQLGLTDPAFNAPCVDASGNPVSGAPATDPSGCQALGLSSNTAFQPGLAGFDLTRGGSLFTFNGSALVKQQAVYAQDSITFGHATAMVGVRFDRYDGLTTATSLQPRVGLSYLVGTGTVLRASYGRTMETPYNENLVLSSATGSGGLAQNTFGAVGDTALQPGRRDQVDIGLQQAFGRWLVFDVDYLYKRTTNAYDFDTLFNTPIVFPISWAKSQINGLSGRINLVKHRGFSAFTVLGHNRARFFNPENGGILFNSPLPTGVFRIDHDQVFQQTTNLLYQAPGRLGAWGALTWRYDSGLVAGSVPDLATALTLTPDEQAAIGLFCGSTFATPTQGLSSCSSPQFGATRLVIPAAGTENDDTNPPRIAPRHLFDIGVGLDSLVRTGRGRLSVRLSVMNVTNKVALYNFLSTFSGTHFVAPRTLMAEVKWTF